MKGSEDFARLAVLLNTKPVLFLDLGHELGRLSRGLPSTEFARVLRRNGISYRRARYLVFASETAKALRIRRKDSMELGWTKFSVIAPILTPENKDDWVEQARELTVLQLKAKVQASMGRRVGTMPVFFTLTVAQRGRLEKALVRAGAISKPQGLLRKAEALDQIVREWLGNQ